MIKLTSDFTYIPSNNYNQECSGTFKANGQEYEYKGEGTREEAKFAAKQFAKHQKTDKNFNIKNFSFKQVETKSGIYGLFKGGFDFISSTVSSLKNNTISLYNHSTNFSNLDDFEPPKIEEKKAVLNKSCKLESSELELEEINTDGDEKIEVEEFIYTPPQRPKTKSKNEADQDNMFCYNNKKIKHEEIENVKKAIINLNELPKLKTPLNLDNFQEYEHFKINILDFFIENSTENRYRWNWIEDRGWNSPQKLAIKFPKNLDAAQKLVNLFYFMINKKLYVEYQGEFFSLVNIIQQFAGDRETGNLLLLNAHPQTDLKDYPFFSFKFRCYCFIDTDLEHINLKNENHGILVRNLIKILEKSMEKELKDTCLENISKEVYKQTRQDFENALDTFVSTKKFEELLQKLNETASLYLLKCLKELIKK